jgi:hypothetical protein
MDILNENPEYQGDCKLDLPFGDTLCSFFVYWKTPAQEKLKAFKSSIKSVEEHFLETLSQAGYHEYISVAGETVEVLQAMEALIKSIDKQIIEK